MKRIAIIGILVIAVASIWLVLNPPGRFGFCSFAWTTYSILPRPLCDIQVRVDGETRIVKRTHDLHYDQIQWLLEPKPDLLIIGTGWDGVVRPDEKIRTEPNCEVRILPTPDAIRLFNELKGKRKVAIHVHSTC